MPRQLNLANYLQAIKDLKIDVPIMDIEEAANGALTFYLYGGGVKHWPPDALIVVSEPTGEGPAFQEPARSQARAKRGAPKSKTQHKRHNSEMKEES